MRAAAIIFALALFLRTATAEEEFPYPATVAHEAALTRCGPGESFYPTSRLLQGTEVEVHRHGPNGWCAIRPLDDDFCLISADCVKLLPGDDLAEVVDKEAAVWIGSNIAKPEQHRWQIHLQPGERATVLGVRAGPTAEGVTATWYKIAPPAGEFRWIHQDALHRGAVTSSRSEQKPGAAPPLPTATPPAATESTDEPPAVNEAPNESPPAELPVEALAAAKPLSEADELKTSESPEPSDDVLPMPASPGEQLAANEDNAVMLASLETPVDALQTPVAQAAATVETISEPQQPSAAPPLAAAAERSFLETNRQIEPAPRQSSTAPTVAEPPVDANASPQNDFDAEFAAIEVDLTLAVAQDLSRWRLGPIHDRAARLRDSAVEPENRQQTERLMASIERFEQLYDRYRTYAQGTKSPASGRPSSTQPKPTSPEELAASNAATRGLLAPLSSEVDSPPFALLDAEGRISAYVTPAAGVDLTRYAGRTVAVYGSKAMDDVLQAPHIVADRALIARSTANSRTPR